MHAITNRLKTFLDENDVAYEVVPSAPGEKPATD